MQYRTFKFIELSEEDYYTITVQEKQFQIKDNLIFAESGAVANYEIQNDYMIDNNSTIKLVTTTEAVAGQIITIIIESGAYDTGVITAVDNKLKTITYKSLLELFNQEMLNPYREANVDDDIPEIKYSYDAINDTGLILASYYLNSPDKNLRLPLVIRTSGGTDLTAIWQYDENSFNIKEWLINLFNDKNVVVQMKIVFEVDRGYIDCLISQNTTGGYLIKNNQTAQKITLNETQTNTSTVCTVIDSATKEILSNWYLLQDNTVTEDIEANNRVLPYKLVVAEYDQEEAFDTGATEQQVAEDELLYSEFNNYTEIKIDKNSKVFDNLVIGDSVTIIPEIFSMKQTDELFLEEEYEKYLLNSIYTGRKEKSTESRVTYIFGKGRVNYTDIIQQEKLKNRRN